MVNSIHIYDLDGTLIDSNEAVRQCQIDGLLSVSGIQKDNLEARSEANIDIGALGLRIAVDRRGVDMDTFFREHYHTFDPFEAVKKEEVYAFSDAVEAIERYSNRLRMIVSNSDIAATRKKIEAVGWQGLFDGIFAEFKKGLAKPEAYMGKMAVHEAKGKGFLTMGEKLIFVGDQEIDIQFGHNMKEVYENSISLLIDREGGYKGSIKPDGIIRSLTEIGDYE